MPSELKERKFVAYWDCLGFECIVDMTRWERQRLLDDISGGDKTPAPVNLHALVMRAQFNTQRSPEIWVFTTVDEINEADMIEFAKTNPQGLANLIRERGTCVFKSPKQKQVIK